MNTGKLLAAVAGLLVLIVLLGGCSGGGEGNSDNQTIKDVSMEEAFALMEDNQGEGFVIVDLRSAEDYARGHIQKAINIDYQSADFAERLAELDREDIYLLYSQKDEVSGEVLDMMAELGFSHVYNMLGGMDRWERVGMPQVQ